MVEVPVAIIEAGLRQINLSGRIAKGFNCTIKAIIKGKAKIFFLATDGGINDYKTLITALCRKHSVKIQEFPAKAALGAALGLTKLKADGTARASPKCQRSCAACALLKYGNVQNKAVEDFRGVLDPEAKDGEKGSA
jgi:small subunit ribosomal protein S12e